MHPRSATSTSITFFGDVLTVILNGNPHGVGRPAKRVDSSGANLRSPINTAEKNLHVS
jgi:hypothetical protein